ncbi:epimerase family protein SDR39U1 [Condylostylus longicornis]|uniref:epimerase family protein SDR39U1 n=1 Tax=Condylostylus longicornis TaxID=2530218 RepID=UPI00244E5B5E|nr:epimerase family protein SDR39U1 [Condylostylus longicornis]
MKITALLHKHVLIGGGSGFIGRNLSKLLKSKNYEVTVVSRMPGTNRITWLDIQSKGIPEKITSVVNLAGQNVLDPKRRWTPGFKQNVWNSRVNSTRILAEEIIKSKRNLDAFINISGVSLYKPSSSKTYNENHLGESFDFMSKLCIEWEKAATIPENENCRSIKLRTGVVLGPGGGMIESIWMPFVFGLGGPMGNGDQYLPWIHMDDLCNLILYCIENKNVKGILNGVAPQIVTNGEFSKIFASCLKRPALIPFPEFAVKLIFGKDRSALLLTGAKIEPKLTIESGFKYGFPIVKGACEDIIKKVRGK